MKTTKTKYNKRILLYVFLFLASIVLFFFNSIFVFIALYAALLLFLLLALHIDIKNPVLSLTLILILYQISYPVLNGLGIKVFEYETLNDSYYIYSWLATVAFIIAYGSLDNVKYDRDTLTHKTNLPLLRIIYLLLVFISLFASYTIVKSGFGSKYDIANSSTLPIRLGSMAYTALIIMPLYFLLSTEAKKREKATIVFFNLVLVMIGMFTYGERSYVFNYLAALGIYYCTFKKVSIGKIALAAIGILFFVAASSSMKMLLANDNYKNAKDYDNGVIVTFLNSDFASAGFNFNYLLNREANNIFHGKTYVYDILSPIDDLINVDKYSATKWYQQRYWADRKTGLGFTILGEGYINFGLVGVLIEMILFSRIIKYFYSNSNKGYIRYIIFIGSLTLAMYSCRQALANTISPLVKYHFVLAMLVIFLNGLITKRKKNEKSIQQ